MRSRALPPDRNVDDRRQWLREVHRAIGRSCVCQRARRDRVGIAATVQQEILVLHVGETFRIEGHADKMEVRIEAVNLEGILDVVTVEPSPSL